jgi:hypothetical protein
VLKVEKRVPAFVANEDDVAAVAAIAPGRASEWDVTLAPKCGRAVAAVAGLNSNNTLINESHGGPLT